MLYRNDIFALDGGERFRLLHTEVAGDRAWIISMDNTKAWPVECSLSEISNQAAIGQEAATARPASQASLTQRRRARQALDRIQPLVGQVPVIFDKHDRSRLIKEHAPHAGCTDRTLWSLLRKYWQNGQTMEALYGNFHRCGRSSGSTHVTARRGRRPKHDTRSVYQIGESDVCHFEKAVKNDYLKDDRRTVAATFRQLLSNAYSAPDGNGDVWILPAGERPTLRQFEHYLRTRFPQEVRLRSRKGDKEFERNHRAKIGTVMKDCQGVGHIYEIDATIADVYLVSSKDVRQIIGKPTLYLIIDRRSRLIVGFYIGLENASWIGATQAIRSISADKSALCARYGVAYDPEDWPAHMVMPQQFFCDRGEMVSKASNQVAESLGITIANMPALRPDWKPLVECGFKTLHQQIAEVAPAYDPPSNAMKRRGKHYEKDACLTLDDFTKLILEAIIAHNRKPMRAYDAPPEELMAGVEPSPIGLWNHGIVSRAGLLSRYSEERVRFALLPRDQVVVTDNGLSFRGCFYTCPEAMQKGWFVKARNNGRFKLDASYDPRMVDAIYIHDASDPSNYYLATLTDRSDKYAGLSFAEVDYYDWLRKKALPAVEQARLQVNHEFRTAVEPTVTKAKARLKAVGKTPSRSARRADTVDARSKDLQRERLQAAQPLPRTGFKPPEPIPIDASPPTISQAGPLQELTLAQKLQQARKRMMNG